MCAHANRVCFVDGRVVGDQLRIECVNDKNNR